MEFGGYLPLELKEGNEYFQRYSNCTVRRFNSGRSSMVAALNASEVNNVYIPYYNCHVVEEALIKHGYHIVKYKIDAEFMPILDTIENNDWIIYINYFGICKKETLDRVIQKYKNVIIDNTQAFFSQPIIEQNVFNIYSCRKFFGVADGAYLVCDKDKSMNENYEEDCSWYRCGYLIKSIEKGTNAAYSDSLASEESLGYEVKLMSRFTYKMMKSIDYEEIIKIRRENYNFLVKEFSAINELKLTKCINEVPMVYPLFIENDGLRKFLINNKIYVPQWWKYLLHELDRSDYEYKLSNYLFPLPIDQRYNIESMKELVSVIMQGINGY